MVDLNLLLLTRHWSSPCWSSSCSSPPSWPASLSSSPSGRCSCFFLFHSSLLFLFYQNRSHYQGCLSRYTSTCDHQRCPKNLVTCPTWLIGSFRSLELGHSWWSFSMGWYLSISRPFNIINWSVLINSIPPPFHLSDCFLLKMNRTHSATVYTFINPYIRVYIWG